MQRLPALCVEFFMDGNVFVCEDFSQVNQTK